MNRTIVGITVSLVAAGIAMAAPASATVPEHEVQTDLAWFQANWAVPDIDCGAFTIHETALSGRQDVAIYRDDTGNITRVFEHTSYHGMMTNLATGKTIRDYASDNSWFPFVDGQPTVVISTGIDWHLTDGHRGIVVAFNGRLIHDDLTGEVLFVAGPHDVAPHETPDLCSLLG